MRGTRGGAEDMQVVPAAGGRSFLSVFCCYSVFVEAGGQERFGVLLEGDDEISRDSCGGGVD